ncbi:hypothetical protein TNCV_3413971 [Trichonephila clavipes]|uniref:Uncharacterized protein n=1 Tax=Trichonephila clavipes TaxID=2585209 RepID=A0A8X6RPD6_TRICX|nr:hypothetical protein TNCV_3413971 [Trichonephila clavipes]
MEWQSTRWNIEGFENTYASGHRGSLRVFPHTTIPTYLCCVTRLQESLLKCYAYWMVLTYDVFYVICMRSIATTVPRNQGSYFLGEIGGMGPFKGLSAILKSASKRLSSSSDARPMTQSECEGLASVSMAFEVLEVFRLRDLLETGVESLGESCSLAVFKRTSLAGLALDSATSSGLGRALALQCRTPSRHHLELQDRRDYTPADRAARTCWLGCPGPCRGCLRHPLHGRFLQDPTSPIQRSSKVQNPAPSASFPREQSVVSSYQ